MTWYTFQQDFLFFRYRIAHVECLSVRSRKLPSGSSLNLQSGNSSHHGIRSLSSLQGSPRSHAQHHDFALMQKYVLSTDSNYQDALSGSVPQRQVEDELGWVSSALEIQKNDLDPEKLEKHHLARACGEPTLLELSGDELNKSSLSISQFSFAKKLQEEF